VSTITRALMAAAASIAFAVVLTGCVPEPTPGDTPSSAPSSEPPSAGTPTPLPTSDAEAPALPADCTEIYSAGMLATLEADNPPLNDPGVSLFSTDQAALLELLDSTPTVRCSWGVPSDYGLATNVTPVSAEQRRYVLDALTAAGFGCEEDGATTYCRIEQRGVSLEDAEFVRGETHALADGLWVSTNWINFSPDGYTEDVVSTLVG
jgi:hypothetical protein